MVGRAYLDPGDRLSGRRDPPVRVVVLARWGRPDAQAARHGVGAELIGRLGVKVR